MNRKSKIAVCDSGLGGISVLNQLIKILPNENYIYMADSKRAPYGKKSPKEVVNLIENVFDTLLLQDIKLIVVACNTASTQFNSLGHKEKYSSIPMFFTEPRIIDALHNENNKNILLMATKVTCESDFVKNVLISEGISEEIFKQKNVLNKNFITKNNKNITIVAAEEIVPFVEKNKVDSKECYELIENCIGQYKNIDAVILGCTHFPFVKHIIEDILTKNNEKHPAFFDNSDVIANNVKNYLEKNDIFNSFESKNHEIKIIDTLEDKSRLLVFKNLINAPSFSIEFLN